MSATKGLPANGSIELAFDRLLLPRSVVRQTFVLKDLQGNILSPTVAYDPVARIVTISPPSSALQGDQMYRLDIVSPQGPTDVNGLRATDGATLAGSPLCASGSAQPCTIEFPVVAGDSGIPQTSVPTVNFCTDVYPIFQQKCGGSTCHGGKLPAAGLLLDSPSDVQTTAIGRVAHGANTGPRSAAQPPGLLFGIDMPIIDPGSGTPSAGDPGQSWLLYKVMLATPPAQSTAQAPTACDGGAASLTDVSTVHALSWQPLSDGERSALSNMVLGREMPFPAAGATPGQGADALTVAELERISRWIAQSGDGKLVPTTCDCAP